MTPGSVVCSLHEQPSRSGVSAERRYPGDFAKNAALCRDAATPGPAVRTRLNNLRFCHLTHSPLE
jgi:hypothetical protein